MLGGVITAAVAARIASDADLDVLLPCPFHAATGLDCPGCGTTRALIALTRGDLITALDHNLLVVLAIPVLLLGWAVRARAGRPPGGAGSPRPARPAPAWLLPTVVTLVLVFAVVRNIPGVPFLGAAAG